MSDAALLDPQEAYDVIAELFGALSERRRAYLASIEQLIIDRTPQGARSLLDIGAGWGDRSLRIAASTGIPNVTLLEPSAPMRRDWPSNVQSWPIRAEQLGEKTGNFDLILCLWNVLGHLFPASARVDLLRQCASFLAPAGRIMLDVNNRYNVATYGFVKTAFRAFGDLLISDERRGDVRVHWNVDGRAYSTSGHVFTPAEFVRLVRAAGLTIEEQLTVDYQTGAIRRSRSAGNPLYVLRRS